MAFSLNRNVEEGLQWGPQPSLSHAAPHQLARGPPFRLSRTCPCDGHVLRGGDLGRAASSPCSPLKAAPLGHSPATRLVGWSHGRWTADGAGPGLHWAQVWGQPCGALCPPAPKSRGRAQGQSAASPASEISLICPSLTSMKAWLLC